MSHLPASLHRHRIRATAPEAVCEGHVRYAPLKSAWLGLMLVGTVAGCVWQFSLGAFAAFLLATGSVLLFGHSLGSHRKLIHDSYQCPKWLEYLLVYCGVQVGLSGPLGLLQQHELRDYAQRLPTCHDYLRHGRPFWIDAWWQLHCELVLTHPPQLRIEPRIAEDRFYRFLERTWMAQQVPWAILLYQWGGWSWVCWVVCARVLAGVSGHWLIGYFAHNHGEMSYEVRNAAVQGRNIRWTSLLTMGECWHNNHHAFPGSARLGLRPGEWDPGWWVLSALQRCGLVWQIRQPADLPHRPELVPCVQTPRIGLRQAIAFATGTPEHLPLLVRWPARRLSERTLLRWFGGHIDLQHDPQARRFSIQLNGTRVLGLPAVWITLAHHCTTARHLTWLAMPLAFGIEQLRSH